MNVKELIEYLSTFSESTEVFVQTVREDLAQPLRMKAMPVWPANIEDRHKILNREKIVITAFLEQPK